MIWMNSDLYFDGKQYISSSRAAKISGYVNDYIGQLCRDGKLECRMVGRSWYVSFESLISHKNANGGNAKSRAKKSGSYNPQNSFKDTQQEVNIIPQDNYREVSFHTSTSSVEPVVGLKNEVVAPVSVFAQVTAQPQKQVTQNAPLVSPYVEDFKSHHSVFEKRFPKVVMGMVAFLFAISVFQFSLSTNQNTQVAYKNLGNLIQNSVARIFPAQNISSANVSVATRSGFDQFAISFYKTVHGILFDTRETIVVLFGGEIPEEEKPAPHLAQGSQSVTDGQGMVVVPVQMKTDQDAVIAKIKDSFSDEVNVLPKEDGVSGVITPVFKKAANDDYLYVLVPIKN